ncbi:MAG: helix-turn-helix domain-containing protein [Pseudohongiellaceae bacterium]
MLGLVNPEFVILNFVTGRVAAATPAVLWLFAHALFIDDRKVTPLPWFFLISYQIARGYVTYIDLTANGAPQNLFISALNALALLVALGLTLHVIIMATREFSIDLLEERRRIRGPFAAGLGMIMAMLVASILLPLVVSQQAAALFTQFSIVASNSVTFVFFLLVNLFSFRLAPGSQLLTSDDEFKLVTESNNQLKLEDADIELVGKLDRKMLEEKLFADPELTIGQLAQLLSVQEYKLRIIINRELGYKNFNQFLNHYRINEACVLLKKKTKYRNISIVANDVGYASLSTFNQAFKKLNGSTPSEFKAKHNPAE